jgi:hypothetical protein
MDRLKNIAISKIKNNTDPKFFAYLSLLVAVIIVFYQTPLVAMWIGFGIAGYSAIANDSIQTLGTFLASNKHVRWWILWIFIASIMVAVFSFGWITNAGDIAYDRLDRIPQPESFAFLQLLAPVVLLILTKFKIPVSTTFLILSVFSTNKTIISMLQKTAVGYILAFVAAYGIWWIIAEMMRRKIYFHSKYNIKKWRVFQWITTAILWSTWLMQDTANIVVFLPRSLSLESLVVVIAVVICLLGILLFVRGGRIQEIVTEKKDVVDVRSATFVDLVFALLLFVFKEVNNVPMSTTWVFLGLLAGRELALTSLFRENSAYLKTLKLVIKDISFAAIGLAISLLIAWGARSAI